MQSILSCRFPSWESQVTQHCCTSTKRSQHWYIQISLHAGGSKTFTHLTPLNLLIEVGDHTACSGVFSPTVKACAEVILFLPLQNRKSRTFMFCKDAAGIQTRKLGTKQSTREEGVQHRSLKLMWNLEVYLLQ